MTQDSKHSFFTGLFVFIGLSIFGTMIYIFSGDSLFFSRSYRMHSYFKDTQGLMYGSIVSFSGIMVGNVRDITYDPEKKALKVEYSIKKSFLPFIKSDSKAQLKTQGALGDRFVFLTTGSASSPSVQAGSEVPADTAPDLFEAVQNKINGLPNFETLFKKIELLVDNLNSDAGLKGATTELKTTLANFKEISQNLNAKSPPHKTIKKLDQILAKINQGSGTLGKLINDPALYNKINRFMGKQQTTSSYLKEMARKSIELNE